MAKSTNQSSNYKEIELLLRRMDLPVHRRKVVNTNDIRWLNSHLTLKNSSHPNYANVMELIQGML